MTTAVVTKFGADRLDDGAARATVNKDLAAHYLRPVARFAYLTGWRVPSEALMRQWKHVDLEAGMVRLEPGETKNRKGPMFPFGRSPELKALLEEQRARTSALVELTGEEIAWVFHRQGSRISRNTLSSAWRTACKKAGLEGKIPHDFRRTAVRNLERAGVSRSVAMKLTGHETETV